MAKRKNITTTQLALMTQSLIHISEPTRQEEISYAVFCLKKKNKIPLIQHNTSPHLQNHT